jgi:hypothetical protein
MTFLGSNRQHLAIRLTSLAFSLRFRFPSVIFIVVKTPNIKFAMLAILRVQPSGVTYIRVVQQLSRAFSLQNWNPKLIAQ